MGLDPLDFDLLAQIYLFFNYLIFHNLTNRKNILKKLNVLKDNCKNNCKENSYKNIVNKKLFFTQISYWVNRAKAIFFVEGNLTKTFLTCNLSEIWQGISG